MRVLFSCLPAYGHLLPMVPLARAFARAGHEVVVATGSDMAKQAAELGLVTVPVGPTREAGTLLAHSSTGGAGNDTGLADGYSLRRMWDHYTYVHKFTTIGARLRAIDLLPLVREWEPALVVHDVADFAAPLVAAQSGVLSVLHSWGPPLPGKVMRRAGQKAAALWQEAGLPAPPAGGMYRGGYLNICPPALWPEDAGELPLVQPLRPAPVTGQGGAFPQPDALPFDRTVHVTLGTVANRTVDVFRLVVESLEGLAVNVVVTVGPDREPEVLGTQPPHVSVASYLPIDVVLSRCDAVVSHGGSGTMLAALRAGLPQLHVPFDGDNIRNARLCETAGASLHLPAGSITEPTVRAAVSELLDSPRFAEAARRVQAEIERMPDPEDVVGILERAVYTRRSP